VAGLALPRLRYRPDRQRARAGRRPPPPRRGRAGHPRPQTRRRAAPLPSGVLLANAAWLVIAALAHNLLRWVATVGLGTTGQVVAKTLRRHLLVLPGRLTRSARRRLLHLPCDWPWPDSSSSPSPACGHFRCVPDLPGVHRHGPNGRQATRPPARAADRPVRTRSSARHAHSPHSNNHHPRCRGTPHPRPPRKGSGPRANQAPRWIQA
jgi:hypothetical protein